MIDVSDSEESVSFFSSPTSPNLLMKTELDTYNNTKMLPTLSEVDLSLSYGLKEEPTSILNKDSMLEEPDTLLLSPFPPKNLSMLN